MDVEGLMNVLMVSANQYKRSKAICMSLYAREKRASSRNLNEVKVVNIRNL